MEQPKATTNREQLTHRTVIESRRLSKHTEDLSYRYRCVLCNKLGKYQRTPEGTKRGSMAHVKSYTR